MNYYYKKQVSLPFSLAVERTKSELAKEGFGILTEIDVKETLQKKLEKAYDNYIILGACNPPLAYEALRIEKDIGLLLPCNVVVYEDSGSVNVSTIVPSVAMGFVEQEELKPVAGEVGDKLKRVVDAVAES